MRIFMVSLMTLGLGACQTTYDSAYNAEMVCSSAGIKRGSRTYDRCANAAYQENRRQSDQATQQIAMGVAAGLIGGVLVGTLSNNNSNNYYYGGTPRYYGHYGYYQRPPHVIYGPRPGYGHSYGYRRGW